MNRDKITSEATQLPVCRWDNPADLRPLAEAIRADMNAPPVLVLAAFAYLYAGLTEPLTSMARDAATPAEVIGAVPHGGSAASQKVL